MSNMTIAFLKVQPKNTQIRHFWSQIQAFLFFREILQLDKFEGADFKYDNIVFKFQPKNTKMRHIWSQIQAFLFFSFIACFHFMLYKRSTKKCKNPLTKGILYKTNPDPDPHLQKKRTPNLQKKRTLYQNSLNELKTHFCQI